MPGTHPSATKLHRSSKCQGATSHLKTKGMKDSPLLKERGPRLGNKKWESVSTSISRASKLGSRGELTRPSRHSGKYRSEPGLFKVFYRGPLLVSALCLQVRKKVAGRLTSFLKSSASLVLLNVILILVKIFFFF